MIIYSSCGVCNNYRVLFMTCNNNHYLCYKCSTSFYRCPLCNFSNSELVLNLLNFR